MPRKRRVWYPGAIYHVMSRGNRKEDIFKTESDYMDFLECIESAKEEFGFLIHALCLMTNHFHIVLETKDQEIWRIMHKVLLTYAVCYNKKYNLTGHLFGNRYRAQVIETERYFLEVSRYIHLNPVKAQMVRDPIAYDYSSYGKYILEDYPLSYIRRSRCRELIYELTDTTRILSYFGDNPCEQYRIFVEEKVSHEEQERMIQKEMWEDDMWLPR